jgi:hypothetical protein
MQVSDDRFQAESEWKTLTLLVNGHQKPARTCMKLTSPEFTVENH